MSEQGRAGGCEWLGNGVRVQYARCWACICAQCPGGNHPWAGADDIAHAELTSQPDPSEQKCGCVCADGPELPPADDEPEWESLNAVPCSICGNTGACGTDSDGNDWAHIEPYDEDAS